MNRILLRTIGIAAPAAIAVSTTAISFALFLYPSSTQTIQVNATAVEVGQSSSWHFNNSSSDLNQTNTKISKVDKVESIVQLEYKKEMIDKSEIAFIFKP